MTMLPPQPLSPAAPTVRRIWLDLLLYPTHTLPTAAAPLAVAAALSWHDHVLAPLPVLIAFLASWLIHVGGIFIDNYELLTRHPQIREHPELNDAVADGTLRLPALRLAVAGWFVLAALCGPYLLHVAGWPVVAIGVVGMMASFAYAGGPMPYAKLGVADPLFVLMFGIFAVVGLYYVSAAATLGTPPLATLDDLPWRAFVVGLPAGLMVTNVLVIDDIRDHVFDAQKGWRTPAVRFGTATSRAEFVVFAAAAYLLPVWFWLGLGFGPWILLPLLTLPAGVAVVRTIVMVREREKLVPMSPRAAFLGLGYSVLLALGIALS